MITKEQSALIHFEFISHSSDRFSHLQGIEMALKGGCKWIQLRCKDLKNNEIHKIALKVRKLCTHYKAVFIVNDLPEMALKTQADGVHLGKTDMPLENAVQTFGNQLIIGYTCNTFEDILHAQKTGADYAGVGPFKWTKTKQNLSPTIGLAGYQQMVEQCRQHNIKLPLIAIGGINLSDIEKIMQQGMTGIAVSSLILNAVNPIFQTQQIVNILNKNKS
ncbi:MAG: thiamine phosphate synthase [Bacteroidales bacterium]|jgi:thiamine-phosphate pyrophosphorylase|nr:thiamine phosphate synthase [Bacteroidales bacterium]